MLKRFCGALAVMALAGLAGAQQPATIEVSPSTLTLKPGETATLTAVVKDAQGNVIPDVTVMFISRSRRALRVTPEGEVSAASPGEHVIIARVPMPGEAAAAGRGGRRGGRGGGASLIEIEITVSVPFPKITEVTLEPLPNNLYESTMLRLRATVWDEIAERRPEVPVTFASSDTSVARVNAFGQLSFVKPGEATITVSAENASASFPVNVKPNPIREFELTSSAEKARTGDVVRFRALAKNASGRPIEGLPVHYAVFGETSQSIIAAGATAHVEPDGRFVAERSGIYTVMASVGGHSAMKTIQVTSRGVRRKIEIVGHGRINERATTDLWVWTAPDGRDYAITGTKQPGSYAYIWDVTDPSDIKRIADIQIDARTINDVKVSEDGSLAIVSREGASNRRNGIVFLDVSSPLDGVKIIGEYDQELTGGVHNVFIYQDHVYALSAGQRYDIINIENPLEPFRVGRFELGGTRPSGIHDVWVVDGIAYSSNWANGIAVVDVGGGGMGGSPANPVKMGQYTYPSGRNHAAFPYRSKSTGKFYVFAGDEAFPERFPKLGAGTPRTASGWIHVIEWDKWEEPREVARYEVPEAGTHNFWIEDDVLYVAYYNGGLRVVDVSGDLLGNLYRQGREIAYWLPWDPEGRLANSPNTWGAQPFKGHIYISDKDSGLWALRLGEKVNERIAMLEDR